MMSDASDNVRVLDQARQLAEAVRSVKNAEADRDDVVIEMRDAERMRLEIFANELKPVISEVPSDIDVFDFALSSGLKPRFWVDSVSHVSMGHDKRVYRFLKDTRNGRIILAESTDARMVADRVTRYIAERMVERERMMEGGMPQAFRDEPAPARALLAPPVERQSLAVIENEPSLPTASPKRESGRVFWGIVTFLLGALFGFALLATQLWERIAAGMNP